MMAMSSAGYGRIRVTLHAECSFDNRHILKILPAGLFLRALTLADTISRSHRNPRLGRDYWAGHEGTAVEVLEQNGKVLNCVRLQPVDATHA